MKKLSLLALIIMLSSPFAFSQMIESFDNTATDSTFQISVENGSSSMTLSQSSDKVEGSSALSIRAVIGSINKWGSFSQLIKRLPEGQPALDWTLSDTLSIWLKVTEAPKVPGNIFFRIHIADRPSATDQIEEYIYENATIVDVAGDWVNLKVPLYERWTDGATVPNDSGFVLFPTSWGGGTYNNRKLDINKIIGWNVAVVTSGWDPNNNLPADSITVLYDNFQRTGAKAIPAIIFNGMTWANNVTGVWPWGQSAVTVETGAGLTNKTNAVKWVHGNEWNNGWTGVSLDLNPSFNLAGAWQKDSIQFQMKAQDGVGELRFQLESAAGIRGSKFTPIADNQWHLYKFALKDLTVQDNKPNFDSSAITKFGIMCEASATAGEVVYLTDIWTGNPVFDVVPPVAPTGILATAGSFSNLVTWTDVPNENEEKYDVYYSKSPITDITARGVEVVKLGVAEGIQLVEHKLIAPAADQNVTYYYAIICKDSWSNVGPLSSNSAPLTNMAKGNAVIGLNKLTGSFAADGDLKEFAAIIPQTVASSNGTGFIVTNTKIDSDDDLSIKSYLTFDADNLYVGIDVKDDVIISDSTKDSWLNDAVDLFIGLYDWRGVPHAGYSRGATPDYHLRFAKEKIIFDGLNANVWAGADYAFTEQFPSGYTIEARIPLATWASYKSDAVFVPQEGMRIPIDYAINDADVTAGTRDGILTFSAFNEDKSWETPSRWTYTWIGDKWEPVGVENETEAPVTYSLSQNYPNPFNPSTKIQYTLQSAGLTSIKVYDVMGREVASLVDQVQNAGTHTINFDGSTLSSGVYFYKIQSGSFNQIKKMVLLK